MPMCRRATSETAVAVTNLGRPIQTMAPDWPEHRGRNAGFLPQGSSWDRSDPTKMLSRALGQNRDFDTATYTYRQGINDGPEQVALSKTHLGDTHERTLGGPTAWHGLSLPVLAESVLLPGERMIE